MKLLLVIAGLLLLLGGLVVVGVVATSNLVSKAEKIYQVDETKVNELESEWHKFMRPEAEKALKEATEIEESSRKALEVRKQERMFGLIGGGVASFLGLGLLILGFVVGKKKDNRGKKR
jgi:predicted PurR-regulated permease PerM